LALALPHQSDDQSVAGVFVRQLPYALVERLGAIQEVACSRKQNVFPLSGRTLDHDPRANVLDLD
jgi:hypothetical protein